MAVMLDEIRGAAERVASSLGLDVVDVEFTGSAKTRVLCVYLEKNAEGRAKQTELLAQQVAEAAANPEAALDAEIAILVPGRFATGELNPEMLSWLTHEDCASFSRDFGVLLDVEDLIPEGEYTLEASSPGLDRRLTRKEDFSRFLGSVVKVKTLEPVQNSRQWQGRLTACNGEQITLDLASVKQNSKTKKAGVSTVEIALDKIDRAQVVPEF